MIFALPLMLAAPATASTAIDPDAVCLQVAAFLTMRSANGALPSLPPEEAAQLRSTSGYFNGVVTERYRDPATLAAVLAAASDTANRADALPETLRGCNARHRTALSRLAAAFRAER